MSQPHVPPMQTPLAHRLPQPPQLFGSLFVFVQLSPQQALSPAGQGVQLPQCEVVVMLSQVPAQHSALLPHEVSSVTSDQVVGVETLQ